MNPGTPVTDADLHAYIDNQLSPTRLQEVEAWLHEHPEAVKELDEYQAISTGLHKLLDPVVDEQVPNSLRLHPFWRHTSIKAAATVAWMAIGGLIAWSLNPNAPTVTDPGAQTLVLNHLVQPAAFAHAVYATDTQRPVEINASDEQHLIDWLSERMHSDIKPPSLVSHGYKLIGGRLLPSSDRMAAQFLFENDNNTRVTLYIRRIAGVDAEPRIHFSNAGDDKLNTLYWIEGMFGYAVSGELHKKSLLQLAEATRLQLN